MITEEEMLLAGGSDRAKLAGVSDYGSSLDVFRRVVEGYRFEATERMRLGELMEPITRQLYVERTGYKLLGPWKSRRGYLRFNLDDVAEVGSSQRVVEFKNVHFRSKYQYEDEEDVPRDNLCQVQVYMEEIGAQTADIAALVDGELRIVTVRYDPEICGILNEATDRFWRDHIITKIPPSVDSSESSSKWLKDRFKTHKEPAIQSIPFIDAAAANYERYEAEMEAAKEKMKLAKNIITEFIGTAKGVTGLGWRAGISDVKGKLATNWEAIAAEVGIPEEIIQKHTTIGAGYPRFNFSRTK